MEEKNNKYQQVSGSDAFEEMLKKEQMKPELIEEVMEKIAETSEEVHNIIFVFTDNDVAVTGVHVPRSALNGEDGPVIFKNSKENSLTAAFSREYIEERIQRADDVGERAGLGSVIADQVWISELEKIVEEVRIKIANTPPRSWDELLKEGE
jgi:hypothetical protein